MDTHTDTCMEKKDTGTLLFYRDLLFYLAMAVKSVISVPSTFQPFDKPLRLKLLMNELHVKLQYYLWLTQLFNTVLC